MSAGPDPHTLLQRVLLLERRQGFQNRAAVGGLSSFALQQLQRAGARDGDGLRQAATLLENYAEADRHARENAVAAALHAVLTRRGDESTSPVSTGSLTVSRPRIVDGGNSVETRAESPEGGTARRAPKPATSPRPRLSVVHSPDDLDREVETVRGVGKAISQALGRLGVLTVRDLLLFFPRTHYDYSDTRSISRMRLGQPSTLVGTIEDVRTNRTRRSVLITTATISDDTGTVGVRWFNQPYLVERLPVGARIAVTGEPEVFNGYFTFIPRDYEIIEDVDLANATHAGRLVPVYPLTKGLYQRPLRQLMRRVVEEYTSALVDFVPAILRQRYSFPDLVGAIHQYHFPDDEHSLKEAERRLAFNELFLVQLGLLHRKRLWQQAEPGVSVSIDESLQQQLCASLPFSLTNAQRRVIGEILNDMSRPVPMSRLLQGDVGSGKTVVAAAALLQTVASGKQGVLMAPTEILAEQHYRTVSALLAPFGVETALLVGSMSKTQRKAVHAAVSEGITAVLVGTHALIQEQVEFARLGLAVTDEQHRFGVEQRAALRLKGLHPHTLAMTATPIPRTLAMTIYGDLDVSVIDEMPPGRMAVITTWCRRPADAYSVLREEVRKGRQGFVICPVIEESMESDMRSVVAEHKELQSLVFPELRVALLHGRMKPALKESTLDAFRQGEFHILVATSLVEVGIDVPNATVMVIRDAHRFGLAQLHQFRGRVGRGGDQAYCVLLSPAEGDEARERLEALTATDNGFELAEEDLRLRGPGEFWGTRQSGLPELRVAKLGDLATIELARHAAGDVLAHDPDLMTPDLSPLREQLRRFWADGVDLS